jgi:hypothetical protein
MMSMIREGQNLGITLPETKPPIQYTGQKPVDDLKKLYAACETLYKAKPEILIVVYLDNDHGTLYNQIKYVSECKVG